MKRVIASLAIGFALFFLVDALLFRTPAYWAWINPASTVGFIKKVIRSIADSERIAGRKTVLIVGDSRVAEGFSFIRANARAAELHSPIRYSNGGIAGIGFKPMYFFLRDIDPDRRRFSAVVLMISSFTPGLWERDPGCDYDVPYSHALVTPLDFVDLVDGCATRNGIENALRAVLSAGSNYRADLLAFALNPRQRIAAVSLWNRYGEEFSREYAGRDETLDGLALDPATGTLRIPATLDAPERKELRAYAQLMQEPAGAGGYPVGIRRYARHWLVRIIERYAASGTPVILAQHARGPLYGAIGHDAPVDPLLADLQRQGKIVMLPASLFREVEEPHFYFDSLHLNKYGRDIMSVNLATALSGLDLVH